MTARLLDGRALSRDLNDSLLARLKALKRAPRLVLVRCAAQDAAGAFFRSERRACAALGIDVQEHRVDAGAGEAGLTAALRDLSKDASVDAVLVEMPLPSGFHARRALEALAPEKDVEGLGSLNQGRFYGSKSVEELALAGAFVPCTALALMRLLRASGRAASGARALVIGRSSIVGRPVAHLLSCLDATVTLAHSKTPDLAKLAAEADILVAAVGRPGLVTGNMVKEGAVVLDAGTTFKDGKIYGDVDFEAASARAGWITPVPGGVGPATVTELMNAVVTAAERRAP